MTARQDVQLLQQHPLSAAFPSMSEADIEALSDDIKKHGQREKGMLFEGMVLDGWHRYLACQRIGVEFAAMDFERHGEDPVAFVLSRNLHRRHLTASQRALAVVETTNWRKLGSNQHGGSAPGAYPPASERQMADAAEVGERTIRHAKVAHDAGLGDEVKEGRLSVKAAAHKAQGKPDAPEKPKGDAAKLQARIAALEDQRKQDSELISDLRDQAASAKAFEEKAEFQEMQNIRLELKSVKRRRDELMRENAELKKLVAHWKKKADKT